MRSRLRCRAHTRQAPVLQGPEITEVAGECEEKLRECPSVIQVEPALANLLALLNAAVSGSPDEVKRECLPK